MAKASKIIIDPTSRILYASYYIKGLYDVFGKENVSFSARYFKELNRGDEDYAFEHYFAFVAIAPDKKITRYIVDFCDPSDISHSAYAWCDHYAKINFNINLTDKAFLGKIISVTPGFGIQIWNKWETLYRGFSNMAKCRFSPLVSFTRYFKDYYQQYKRPALEDYHIKTGNYNSQDATPYVFMIATLWEDDVIEETNLKRKRFMELCKMLPCHFEGGFFASAGHLNFGKFKDLIFSKPYTVDSYIEKTKLSEFVFNTPAVHHCHGWKLGEYLAMGKAIISTPLTNALPKNLEHGENIHLVSNDEELAAAIQLLLSDQHYRSFLGEKAGEYYLEYACPAAVIRSIVK
jgi:glycosyltransferase involved in cell wall biosynthesis